MRRAWMTLLAFFLGVLMAWTQKVQMDSLNQIIQEHSNDSLRGAAMVQLSNLMKNREPDSALVLAQNAYAIAESGSWERLKATALLYIGAMKVKKGDYDTAKDSYLRSIALFRTEGDSLGVADVMQALGNIHRRQSEYAEALRYYFDCVKLRKTQGATERIVASSYTNIGNVYYFLEEYDKAREYYHLVLADCEKHGDQEGVVRIYNNIFGTFYSEDKYEKGITYLQKALHLSDSLGLTFFKAANLTNLGETYKAMKQYDLSYRYSQESLALYRQLGDKSRIGMVLKNLGQFAQDIGDHQKAIDFLEESLEVAQEMNYRTNQKEAYENLAISYAEVGQLEKAFAAQQSYILIKDSLVNEASNKELNELKTRFETEQKEQAIAQLEERHADDLRKRRWLLAGLGLLSLLTLITLWAIWQKRRAYSDLLVQQQKTQTLLEEKEEMLEQLIQSEKLASIGELTAGIAHEINNPINFVASNTQALQQDFEEIDELLQMITQLKDLPIQEAQIQKIIAQSEHIDMPYLRAEIQQLIDSIKHGADRTIHIVDSIRHFSRHNKDAFQKANIHQAIDSALTILNNQISKDIQLHRDYGELPLVACQINKISQVFLNIINNAIQAIGNKGELRISTQEQGNWVLISIADNGPGMDEVTRSKIFQPFFTTKDKDKGTGLGLSISHRIIQAHGGRIEVQSQLGEGSVFLIYLPIQQQHKKAS